MTKVIIFRIVVIFTFVVSARATTWNVDVHNFVFVPAALTIAHGDTVHWHNSSGFHSVHHVGLPSLFGTASASAPWDYTFVFDSIGDSTFHYLCQVHPTTMMGTIMVTPAPSILITSPNGGETGFVDEVMPITWSSSNISSDVKIELNRDFPGGAWETLFADVPNAGLQSWTVTSPVSAHCRVRIISLDANPVADISDADFSISILAAPQNVVAFFDGTDVTLTWLPVSGADEYHIYRSNDPGFTDFSDLVGTTPLSIFTDVAAPAGTPKLFYQVRAVKN